MGAGHAFDAVEGGFLGEGAGDGSGDVGPAIGFGVAGDIAGEDHAPAGRSGAEAETAEGDGEQRHPAFRGDAALGVPDLVIAVVGAGSFSPGSVGLDAAWVELEEDAAAVILKRVEKDGDVVVGGDVFAAGEMRTYEAGVVVEAEKDDVERGGGVAEVDFGLLGGGLPVGRGSLGEISGLGQVVLEGFRGVHAFEVGEVKGAGEFGQDAIGEGLLVRRRGRREGRFVLLILGLGAGLGCCKSGAQDEGGEEEDEKETGPQRLSKEGDGVRSGRQDLRSVGSTSGEARFEGVYARRGASVPCWTAISGLCRAVRGQITLL